MKKWIFLILITGFCVSKTHATHIVGGEIMYKYLADNGVTATYEITMYLYVDCINGSAAAIEQDKQAYFNVFLYNPVTKIYTGYNNDVFTGGFPLANARSGPVRVSDLNYNCIKTKPNACVDKYTYKRNISVPVNAGGYLVSFERCCRNNTINNILFPESTGGTYWTTIPPVNNGGKGSSPVFKALPPNFLCTNAPLNFDHSAIDADGDSLVYELFQPYQGASNTNPLPSVSEATNPNNFVTVSWANTYSTFAKQIDGSPPLYIDPKTGKITLIPTATGQFVIGIKVMEFRNGVKIGETKRDYQFNVSNCVFDVVAAFFTPRLQCQNTPVNFTNLSLGGASYEWDFGDPNNPSGDKSNQKTPQYQYSKPGNYTIKLVVKGTSTCNDTTTLDIAVKENFKVELPADTLYCGAFSRVLDSKLPNKSYLWSTNERTSTITVNKEGLYWLKVTDAPCIASDSIYITNDLSTLDFGPDSVICRDSFVQFTYEGIPGYKTYLWDDGTDQQDVFIHQLGTYYLKVTNENDCPSEDSITFVLYPPPKTVLGDTLFCKNTSVVMDGSNLSPKTSSETTYQWSTGENTPTISTFNPGTYVVKVRNKLCTIFDTAILTHIETGLELGPDTFYCGPVNRWLRPKKNYVKYVWSDFSETVDYHALSPGKYKLTITTVEGCVESDSVTISQFPAIDGGLGDDTTICLSSEMDLIANDSFESYEWNTGQTSRSIIIRDSGLYTVTVIDKNGCIVSDSIRIGESPDALPIVLFMPDAFTPNMDFLNETYPGNHYSDPGSPYLLRLYNRWGEKIFESESPLNEWNGTYNGNPAEQDVYVYYIRYVGCDNVERTFRGTFNLLR